MNERDRELAEQCTAQEFSDCTGFVETFDKEKFADLIRADEREACAKLVDPSEEHRQNTSGGYLGGKEGVELLDNIAAAIRARGTK